MVEHFTHAESVGQRGLDARVRQFVRLSLGLSVCLSVRPQHNSKTTGPKVFKLGTGNDLGISYK